MSLSLSGDGVVTGLDSAASSDLGAELAAKLDTPGVWTSWTPAFTQTGALTTSALTAKYVQLGKVIHANIAATFSNAGTTNTIFTLTNLPVTAVTGARIIGTGAFFDQSTSVTYSGHVLFVGATDIRFIGDWSAQNSWGTTPNLAVASGDVFRVFLTYEAA